MRDYDKSEPEAGAIKEREAPLYQVLSRLDKSLSMLNDNLDQLGHRLRPISVDLDEGETGSDDVPGGGSTVVNSLRLCEERVISMSRKVTIMTQSLEV